MSEERASLIASLRIGYADPPYPGQAKLYKDHEDYAGEVDHKALVDRLEAEYDGWVLHTSSTALGRVLDCLEKPHMGLRIQAWVKPFAAFKRNVSVAYAWEPVIVRPARKPVVRKDMGFTYRDWLAVKTEDCTSAELDVIAESITLKRGLTGAKPEKVCHWLFECVGADPGDDLDDMYPGTGAVSRAWETWCEKRLTLDEEAA